MSAAVFLLQLVSVVLLLLAPVLTSCLFLPLDCNDIYHHDNSQPSGVYTIYPIGATSAVQVHFILSGTQLEDVGSKMSHHVKTVQVDSIKPADITGGSHMTGWIHRLYIKIEAVLTLLNEEGCQSESHLTNNNYKIERK